ncbi:MAG: prolyl oligopeptidase family serine peptidase [Candidatus Marinimicrobia bacterium]|nr:prolyl oligopeptidase family serine peptidase [Candidatus Neomarinimicrobiota bacterium]
MKPNFEVRSGQNPAVFKKTLKKEIMVNYLIHLPENYKKDGQSFPMLVFLHGAGERGNDIEKVKAWGPPKIAENDKSFPYVLVSPQCPEGDWWSNPSQLENLYVLITAVMENYNVDKSKVYLTGLSMGGYGTWALAIQHPELFAAIAPICGGGQPRMTRNLVDIPTWVFHGAKDTVVPINESENMVNALKKFGGNVKFTVFPEATHNSWTQAYNETDLLTWFLKYQK